MNAPRRVLRASSNAVKKIYNFGEKSIQGHLIEGSIIVILIILTAIVLKFLPLKFLCFFNNIIVKVIFLIVIAFVALYCPAIGLLLAILLVSIIQMCQRKQLSMEINNIQNPSSGNSNMQPDMNIFESLEVGGGMGGDMGGMGGMGGMEGDMGGMGGMEGDMGGMGGMKVIESMGGDMGGIRGMGGDMGGMGGMGGMGSVGSMGGVGDFVESYQNQGQSMEPQGFNDDTYCVTGCGGSGSGGKKDNRRELDGMCGNVKTWTNQISAQGLDGDVVGLQSSIGYPL